MLLVCVCVEGAVVEWFGLTTTPSGWAGGGTLGGRYPPTGPE